MPRHNPLEPWLHQSRGYWCKKVRGKLEYLDRDYTVAKRKLKKRLAEQAAGKCQTCEWLDAPLPSLCDEFLEDIKLRKPEATFVGYKYRLLRALKVLDANLRVGAVKKFHLTKIEQALSKTHGPTSVRDSIATLQTVFNWACKNDLLESSPIKEYNKPRARQ